MNHLNGQKLMLDVKIPRKIITFYRLQEFIQLFYIKSLTQANNYYFKLILSIITFQVTILTNYLKRRSQQDSEIIVVFL